jgi:hypothetical protein
MQSQFDDAAAGPAVRHVDVVDLPKPMTLERFMLVIRRIFYSNRDIRELSIKKGEPLQVTWVGPEHDSLGIKDAGYDIEEVLSQIDLEEIGTPKWSPARVLGMAALRIESKGMQVSHMLVGKRSYLWHWVGKHLGIDLNSTDVKFPDRVMGGLLMPDDVIPQDVLILVGSPSSIGHLANARVGVKITMEIDKA